MRKFLICLFVCVGFAVPTRLIQRKYDPLGAGKTKPNGWLKKQLEIQAKGLSGHLDLFWNDVRSSMWLGGAGDTDLHERTPYWLNGVTHLISVIDDQNVLTPLPREEYYCQAGIDLYEHDLQPGVYVSSAKECKDLCQQNPQCVAFVINDYDRNADNQVICHLKAEFAQADIRDAGGRCYGWIEHDPNIDVCIPGVDTMYNDLGETKQVSLPSECRDLCEQNTECQAFVVDMNREEAQPQASYTCWLKSALGTQIKAAPNRCTGKPRLSKRPADKGLRERVLEKLQYIVDHQAASGWLGPDDHQTDGNQYWGTFPLILALEAWAEMEGVNSTKGTELARVIYRHLVEINNRLPACPFSGWTAARWADLVLAIQWLVDNNNGHFSTEEISVLFNIMQAAKDNGLDWETFMDTLDVSVGIGMYTHGVNIMQALKSASVWYRCTENKTLVDKALSRVTNLDRVYGMPSGVICADEHLCEAGETNHPSRGSELCAVVEAMYSYENMFAIHGFVSFADRVERIALNALPATWASHKGGDMWNHQYLQAPNMINSMYADPHIWTHDGPASELYGLEPNFGCCTADFSQGWPKFTNMIFFRDTSDDGVVVGLFAPASTKFEKGNVQVEMVTEYPFEDVVTITVTHERNSLPLHVRIPEWATKATATLNGVEVQGIVAGQMLNVTLVSGASKFVLNLNPEIRLEQWWPGSVTVARGPLIYAVNLDGAYKTLMGYEYESVDTEVLPKDGVEWRWALDVDPSNLGASMKFYQPGWGNDAAPFNHTAWPVYITAPARPVPNWGMNKNSADVPPASPACATAGACGDVQTITLVPFGGTDLRVTELPLASHSVANVKRGH